MSNSTHPPTPTAVATASAPLPPGWSEHKAPTGHTYYYNADTKQSTYKRPGLPLATPAPLFAPPPAPPPPPPPVPAAPQVRLPNLSDPHVANAYMAQFRPQPQFQNNVGPRGRGGYQGRPRPQPFDKPRRKEDIPGCEPWVLVYTKYSRRFVYNPDKKASYWRIPEKLMPAILELDKARIREKMADQTLDETKPKEEIAAKLSERIPDEPGDDSEYEEIEVTDDEAEEGGEEVDDGHLSKRQRTTDEADAAQGEHVEFTEADMAAQLQLMGDDYGLEPGDYDDGNMENWPEGTEGVEFSEDDAKCLFKDMLNDFNINPYSPWEKLLEEGKIFEDTRYTALNTTRARKECWDEWSRDRIAELKEQRAKQEKIDPKITYIALLQEKATPKLYWPEFKRKFKKEPAMKDLRMADKDREKAYREHISRLKLPLATRKSDLKTLLEAQPAHQLHRKSLSSGLPTAVLTDVRYISLEPGLRDALVDAFVQSLPPPPEDLNAAEQDEDRQRERESRARRERALEERNQAVEEQKRRREREVAASKERLREGEREIERAMRVDKKGLQHQLAREEGGS